MFARTLHSVSIFFSYLEKKVDINRHSESSVQLPRFYQQNKYTITRFESIPKINNERKKNCNFSIKKINFNFLN